MKIFILTGAGLSAESGVATFRDANGLWNNHSIEDVATPEGFEVDPALVHEFYNARRRDLFNVEPNPAHAAIARLEQTKGVELYHVTQNIDDLCERCGCKNVVHMHGELRKCRCLTCGEIFTWEGDATTDSACPACGSKTIRPHIVWFGEMPLFMDEIMEQLQSCDIFAAIGTSGTVYPAAGFVSTARLYGAQAVLLNKEVPDNFLMFDEVVEGNAGEIVPQWVDDIISKL